MLRFLFLTLLAICMHDAGTFAQNGCTPPCCAIPINNCSFNNWASTSLSVPPGGGPGHTHLGCNPWVITNWASIVSVPPGGTFCVNMTAFNCGVCGSGSVSGAELYVNFNRDGDFFDIGEYFLMFQTLGDEYSGTYQRCVTIPVGTAPGQLRLRLALHFSSSGPCSGQGEIQDYVINVGAPLPIDLMFLEAERANNSDQVSLRWGTSSETNSERFVVERSLDLQSFDSIATVAAAGNSSEPKFYMHSTHLPQEQSAFFRLRQMDFDGTTTFSYVVLVNQAELDGQALNPVLFPNPAEGRVSIKLATHRKADATLELYDAMGKMHYTQSRRVENGLWPNAFDMSRYASGLYFARIKFPNGSSTFHRILHP